MNNSKPRFLVLTDIGGDPDDQQSLVRLLVYANEFDLEGIIPEHWDHTEHKITPEQQMLLVLEYIDAYEKVLSNLLQHSSDYPSSMHLRSILKRGSTYVPFALDTGGKSEKELSELIGFGKDTEGSNWIIEVVDRKDERPVDISVWGGTADLAQALWKVKTTRSVTELNLFVSKIRVHAISDQDATSMWIRETFPNLFYIFNHARNGNKWSSCYRGMFLGGNEDLLSKEWVHQNIKMGHGPLGELYPDETSAGSNPSTSVKEGDTPSWHFFLCNGLNVPSHPEYGGWGGRFTQNGTYYQDAEDCCEGEKDGKVTTWRWRSTFQNDFAARMDRCVEVFKEVNHNPVAILNGDSSRSIIEYIANPGDKICLSAEGSYDPDGDKLSFQWWNYIEAGTYNDCVIIESDNEVKAVVQVPKDGQGKSIHIILEVTDNGEPKLTCYRRVIININ